MPLKAQMREINLVKNTFRNGGSFHKILIIQIITVPPGGNYGFPSVVGLTSICALNLTPATPCLDYYAVRDKISLLLLTIPLPTRPAHQTHTKHAGSGLSAGVHAVFLA